MKEGKQAPDWDAFEKGIRDQLIRRGSSARLKQFRGSYNRALAAEQQEQGQFERAFGWFGEWEQRLKQVAAAESDEAWRWFNVEARLQLDHLYGTNNSGLMLQ